MPMKREVSHRPALAWKIEGLPAQGPATGFRDKLQLFGQFVGSWDIIERRLPDSDPGTSSLAGEAHFNWILGGRAIQDVWGPLDRETKRLIPAGTTIRFYDPNLGAWRRRGFPPPNGGPPVHRAQGGRGDRAEGGESRRAHRALGICRHPARFLLVVCSEKTPRRGSMAGCRGNEARETGLALS